MADNRGQKGMTVDTIRTVIKTEVETLAGKPLKSLDEDIFFKNTFIDSFDMLNLIIFLEQRFGVTINAFFANRQVVGSVNKLAREINAMQKQENAL